MIGIGVIGTLMNTYGAKHLPVLEGIVLIVHIFGFFCIIIPLWVLAPKAPASEVFGTFENFGGWSSIGAACFVGSITATGSFAGSDAAVHLSEETKDASKSVPRMIMFTIVLNGLMGLVFIITYVSLSLLSFHAPGERRGLGKGIKLTRSSAVLLHHQPRGSCHVRESLSLHGRKCLDQPGPTRQTTTPFSGHQH
jgi:amino acid transporter